MENRERLEIFDIARSSPLKLPGIVFMIEKWVEVKCLKKSGGTLSEDVVSSHFSGSKLPGSLVMGEE